MPHSIKLTRVIDRMRMGKHPRTADHILSAIPAQLRQELTSRQIALVADALHAHWQAARQFEANSILCDGGVWDDKHQMFRELAR